MVRIILLLKKLSSSMQVKTIRKCNNFHISKSSATTTGKSQRQASILFLAIWKIDKFVRFGSALT